MPLKNITFLIIIVSLLIGCIKPDEERIPGIYVMTITRNNIDSLFLYQDHTYRHKIHLPDKKTLIVDYKGTWKYDSGQLELDNFYINHNRKFKEGIDYNSSRSGIYVITYARSSFGKISIEIDSDLGNNYDKVQDFE